MVLASMGSLAISFLLALERAVSQAREARKGKHAKEGVGCCVHADRFSIARGVSPPSMNTSNFLSV